MITQDSVLVQLIRLVDRIPTSPPPPRRPRGRPVFYAERLFLKALVIMIVRRLHKVGELLAVLEEHTPEMREVRQLLFEGGRFPSRRTFERRLKALPDSLAEQIGRLGRHLVELLRPWESRGRAVALDSTTLRAKGGVWHKKDREAGIVPHTSIDTEAGWTKSGWHGWVYGWKLHLAIAVCGVWIPLSARLTPANTADNEMAPHLIEELPGEKPASCSETSTTTRPTSGRHAKAPSGSWSPPNEELTRTPMMVSKSDASSTSCAEHGQRELQRAFQFQGHLFEVHGQVPTKGLINTQRFALGAVFVYQLALLYRHERKLDINRGLKPFLRAA